MDSQKYIIYYLVSEIFVILFGYLLLKKNFGIWFIIDILGLIIFFYLLINEVIIKEIPDDKIVREQWTTRTIGVNNALH